MKNDEIEDENELTLDLSIGGIFSKPAREKHPPRRRKREEEKVKKTVGFGSCGSVNGPFVENKIWLESEIVGRNGDVLENEPVRKKEKFCNGNGKGDVNGNGKMTENDGGLGFRPVVCLDDVNSDGQCSSQQGGATDDSRSNSSNYQLDQQPTTTSTASDPSDQPTGSSKQTVSTTKLTDSTTKLTNSTTKLTDSTASEPSLVKPNDKSIPYESNVSNPPSMVDATSQQQQASFLARMPCVSTTGNGPNGKTVSGFLYRYTKNEVSIVCVCHGQSFSPAGFVEHAGGVDITHPLKHITIFPTAFAS